MVETIHASAMQRPPGAVISAADSAFRIPALYHPFPAGPCHSDVEALSERALQWTSAFGLLRGAPSAVARIRTALRELGVGGRRHAHRQQDLSRCPRARSSRPQLGSAPRRQNAGLPLVRWPCDEKGNLIRWFREALKGYSIDELHAISENLCIEFGGHGWIFDETRETLAFSVSEPILADEMIKTVLDNGDSCAAVKRFEGLFETVGLNHRQRLGRMSTLMKTSLSTLHPGQKDRVRQDLDQAPASLAVTALRRLLD